MKYYVCLGDRTTGGGVVIEGNIQTIILGRPVASMGMKAICCNRPQTILQGWAGHLDHGKQIAYDGCLLSCGHKVVASQNLMGWSDGNCSSEPYRVCRRFNILRDYPDDKTKLYPRN
ncbi:PAAR domain-containing protein [Acinetobacter baumannii]|uniref:PAAR domain-containing protein n=1 Tax=Acinetobacter baumannii TaxID=470 RepID=UPI0024B7F081|nr:PAAR domain-containing protein [Acinetobacter baumannii]MDI9733208.1 PAAR domain-containing protein [Acinetobacter baumannii]